MSRASFGRDINSLLGMDSMMDIVTNVLGVLFFVAVFAALSSFEARGKVTTPITTQAITTKAVRVECRANSVIFPGFDEVVGEVVEYVKKLDAEGITDLSEMTERVKDAEISNKYYKFVPKYYLPLYYYWAAELVPIQGPRGEGISELKGEDSSFSRKLEELDPSQHHIFFWVRDDSFEIFHVARRMAIKRGFHVGWDPISQKDPITVSHGFSGKSSEQDITH